MGIRPTSCQVGGRLRAVLRVFIFFLRDRTLLTCRADARRASPICSPKTILRWSQRVLTVRDWGTRRRLILLRELGLLIKSPLSWSLGVVSACSTTGLRTAGFRRT